MDLSGITFIEFILAFLGSILIFIVCGAISLWIVDKCEDIYYDIVQKIKGY